MMPLPTIRNISLIVARKVCCSCKMEAPKKRGRKPKNPEAVNPSFVPPSKLPSFTRNDVNCSAITQQQSEKITHYEPSNFYLTGKLPKVIYRKQEGDKPIPWMTKTDVHCWHDGYSFDTCPWMMPVEKRGAYYVMEGVFCSFACTARYIIDRGGFKQDYYASLLADIAIEHFGMTIDQMSVAPERQFLDEYSKNGVTIKAFREEYCHPGNQVRMALPPFIPAMIVFERIADNSHMWKVRGLRILKEDEREKICNEEKVTAPQPYPGQASLYDKFLESYNGPSDAQPTSKKKRERVVSVVDESQPAIETKSRKRKKKKDKS